MSEDDLVTLGQVTKWLSGGTPDRSNNAYWAGSIPWISAATLKVFDICDSPQRLTPIAVGAGSKLAPVGSTLLLVRGMALHHEVRAGIVRRPVSFNQDVKALVPSPRVLPEFLTHAILSRERQIRDLVSSAGSGTGVLDTNLLKRLLLWVPETTEQARIVLFLDDMQREVVVLDRLIAKKNAIKQGMMQQLLTGKMRLPGFTEPWREVRLGDIASMGSGGTPPSGTAQHYGGGIPWVSISDMTRAGKYVRATDKTLSLEGLAGSAAKLYDEGVVLYAMYASLGECAIAVGRVSSSQAILGIAPAASLNRDYLYYFLVSVKSNIQELGQQGTQANLNAGMVRNLRLNLPPVDEQEAIARCLTDADDEIHELGRRLAKARGIKRGMMQQLLTGRTRLPVAEPEAA
jgi:type I restriction enzyme S subunit